MYLPNSSLNNRITFIILLCFGTHILRGKRVKKKDTNIGMALCLTCTLSTQQVRYYDGNVLVGS